MQGKFSQIVEESFNLIAKVDTLSSDNKSLLDQTGVVHTDNVRLILKVVLYAPFSMYNKLEAMQQQPQHTRTGTNTTTMVMVAEPLAPSSRNVVRVRVR